MKRKLKSTGLAAGLLALASLLPVHAEPIYGMATTSSFSLAPGVALVMFDSATPGSVTTIGAFTGIVADHALRSIDFRPATGELYALSSSLVDYAFAQLYTVDLGSGALTAVGSGLTLTGNTYALTEIDFNPVTDLIRVITAGSTANNFRVDPNTGALLAVDTDLSWAAGASTNISPS